MVQRCPSESAHLGTLRSIACVEGRKVDDRNVVKLGVLLCGLFVGQFDVLWRHVCTMRWLEVILWTHNKSDDVVNDVHDFLRPLIVGSRVRPVQIMGIPHEYCKVSSCSPSQVLVHCDVTPSVTELCL